MITGKNREKHETNLKKVLKCLDENGIKLKIEKFVWKWTNKCKDACKKIKQEISSTPILQHYDPKLPIILATDASSIGIGAVISHIEGVPTTSTARIQRWALLLAGYQYEIEVESSRQIANADMLSRLPLKGTPISKEEALDQIQVGETPLNASEIERETMRDDILSKVYRYTIGGWPINYDACLKEYSERREEITTERGLLWRTKMIIPQQYRNNVLDMIHQGHIGMVKMKMRARQYAWWPNINQDIETWVEKCRECQEQHDMPQKTAIQN
ncbi:uncharacterized protein LOC135926977 [Gordionus sp. m RMFG-2023]|uniref:uncharacterized protein LOC135926977 n=1 Tax=Gordionus sp. m RMFG-2023 TaxID=3053472 RepID=UPI0031FC1548